MSTSGLRQGGEKQGKVTKLSKNEVLMLNIGSMCTGARVIAVSFRLPFRLAGKEGSSQDLMSDDMLSTRFGCR